MVAFAQAPEERSQVEEEEKVRTCAAEDKEMSEVQSGEGPGACRKRIRCATAANIY